MRNAPYCVAALTVLFTFACEEEGIFVVPPEPDAGFIDAGFPDAAVPEPDAGMPEPDAGLPPPAVEPVYIHTGDTLYSYDPDNNGIQRIGQFHDARGQLDVPVVDIAIDLDGIMYGGTRSANGEPEGNGVYVIDPETALARLVFEFDDYLHGMTFLDDGRLVIAGDRVSVVDPITGTVLLNFPAANAYETSGDIVGLPDGNLYWTVRGEQADDVVRIDPSTGRLENLGTARLTGIYGLGYADGQLFGFSRDGFVVVIDPSTGAVLRQDRLDGRWFGATTNPVRWE